MLAVGNQTFGGGNVKLNHFQKFEPGPSGIRFVDIRLGRFLVLAIDIRLGRFLVLA
jgi:hypothetical protein